MSEVIFGSNLSKALAHKGISPETCAARCRIPQHEFDLYVKGICIPDAATLGKIADALSVRVKDLAGDLPLEYTTFGEELRALREAAGINRMEMAELTGIPYKSLVNYESGNSKTVNRANFEKLHEALGEDFMNIVYKYNVSDKANKPRTAIIHPAKGDSEIAEAKRIGSVIKADRKSKGLTGTEYAKYLDVSRTTLLRIESGDYVLTPELEERLSAKVNLDAEPVAITEEPVSHNEKPKLKRENFDLLNFIDDDGEYREAVKELIRWSFEGGELKPVNHPQADLLFKMISTNAK